MQRKKCNFGAVFKVIVYTPLIMSVDNTLDFYISDWFEHFELPKHPEGLYSPIEYTLRSGGKRLRPKLLLAALLGFDGAPEKARWQCLGLEMFHNFTLLHDDVMDKSELRRGQPTVHIKWNENTAILSGDTMLTLATRYMSQCDDSSLRVVLDTFNTTAIEVYEGQQLDMDFENRKDVTVDEYLEMIRLKTSVLLGCALKIGAILGGADSTDVEGLYDFGVNLGIGFQLRDDYLDTFGDPLIFGKQIGGDILNDKKTWLMITALNDITGRQMLKEVEGLTEPDEKINAVRSIYTRLELDRHILELIKHYSQQAVKCLDATSVSVPVKKYLTDIASRLIDRAY